MQNRKLRMEYRAGDRKPGELGLQTPVVAPCPVEPERKQNRGETWIATRLSSPEGVPANGAAQLERRQLVTGARTCVAQMPSELGSTPGEHA